MIWKEIRNDYREDVEGEGIDGVVICIDAWKTHNGNEAGTVIAKVIRNHVGEISVDYIDNRAETDSYAQEIIKDSINELKEELVAY
ncbi:hypothetical protein PP175_28120 (plasmid) [Aneurinibacillus sp. Ricciae_BoGa-3]|uniref:hypothetical protein n=1 Tax=Aneurinibacillus sp. Ricciae_BoGa-3 TaxID=3022697 RepID=UPI0023410BD0|nr:hypothetical protein [Aneurinibacillus sp. Ricciae_BoGa-3]WCK57057.1 hypothetical protein PP175_28120 [Aneurinibacillus sp. Ricciae_BoGa-3]